MALLVRRENFNAHGFDVLTLCIRTAATEGAPGQWSLVPVFDDPEEHLQVTVGGGADCLLNDFRLLSDGKGRPLRLVIARRDLGESYADPGTVHFSFYELRTNREQLVGRPPCHFERVGRWTAPRPYCDVGEAFMKELGLGDGRTPGR